MTMAQVARILESQHKKILYCTSCKTNTVIHSYEPAQIYQCEVCKLDLIEAKASKNAEVMKEEMLAKEDTDEGTGGDEGDIGKLDILEL
jgi:ribosomal protein L37AE/L43A